MTSPLRNATETAGAGSSSTGPEHHVLPVKLYVTIYAALLVLTAITVAVSFAGLGRASIPAALTVAVIKAALVVGYFMHLKYDVRFNSLVFFSSLIFVAIFFSLTMLDLTTRGVQNPEVDNFVLPNQEAAVEAADEAAQPPPETETETETEEHH